MGTGEAIAATAKRNVGGWAGSAAAMAAVGPAATAAGAAVHNLLSPVYATGVGAWIPGVAGFVTGAAIEVAAGIAGAFGGDWVQRAILPDETNAKLDEDYSRAREEHPYVSFGTDLAGYTVTGGVVGGAKRMVTGGAKKAAGGAAAGRTAVGMRRAVSASEALEREVAGGTKTAGRAALEEYSSASKLLSESRAELVRARNARIMAFGREDVAAARELHSAARADYQAAKSLARESWRKASRLFAEENPTQRLMADSTAKGLRAAQRTGKIAQAGVDIGAQGDVTDYFAGEEYDTPATQLLTDVQAKMIAEGEMGDGWLERAARGFGHEFTNGRAILQVPVAGGFISASMRRDEQRRNERLRLDRYERGPDGNYTPAGAALRAKDVRRAIVARNRALIDQYRNDSVAHVAGSIIAGQPRFAVELAMAPEMLAGGGGGLALRGLANTSLKSFFQWGMVAEDYARRRQDTYTFSVDEQNRLRAAIEKCGDPALKAGLRAVLKTGLEVGSEGLGEVVNVGGLWAIRGGGKLLGAGKGETGKAVMEWLIRVANEGDDATLNAVQKFMRASGINPFGEMAEEYVNNVAAAALNIEDPTEDDGDYFRRLAHAADPFTKETAAQYAAFLPTSLLGLGFNGAKARVAEHASRAVNAAVEREMKRGMESMDDATRDRMAKMSEAINRPDLAETIKNAVDPDGAIRELLANMLDQRLSEQLTEQERADLAQFPLRERLRHELNLLLNCNELQQALVAADSILDSDSDDGALTQQAVELLLNVNPDFGAVVTRTEDGGYAGADGAQLTAREALQNIVAKATADMESGALDINDPKWRAAAGEILHEDAEDEQKRQRAQILVNAVVSNMTPQQREDFASIPIADRPQYIMTMLRGEGAAVRLNLTVGEYLLGEGAGNGYDDSVYDDATEALKQQFPKYGAFATGSDARARLASIVGAIKDDARNQAIINAAIEGGMAPEAASALDINDEADEEAQAIAGARAPMADTATSPESTEVPGTPAEPETPTAQQPAQTPAWGESTTPPQRAEAPKPKMRTEYDGLTRNQLTALIRKRGLEVPQRATTDGLRDVLVQADFADKKNGFVRGEAWTPDAQQAKIAERVLKAFKKFGILDRVEFRDTYTPDGQLTNGGYHADSRTLYLSRTSDATTLAHEMRHAVWKMAKNGTDEALKKLYASFRRIVNAQPQAVRAYIAMKYKGQPREVIEEEIFAFLGERNGRDSFFAAKRDLAADQKAKDWWERLRGAFDKVVVRAIELFNPEFSISRAHIEAQKDASVALDMAIREIFLGRKVDIADVASRAGEETAEQQSTQATTELTQATPETTQGEAEGDQVQPQGDQAPAERDQALEKGDQAPKEPAPILSGDEVRKTMPGYDRLDWRTHVDKSGFVGPKMEARFQELLRTRKGKGNGTVVFLAGGNGAGKSTFAAELGATPDFIIDSTLGNIDVARRQIDAVLANGQRPVIVFAYRTPVQALVGIAERIERGGHAVSPLSFANSHTQSIRNLGLLAREYGDRIGLKIYDNSVEGRPRITLEQLEAKGIPNHDELRKLANEKLGQYGHELAGQGGEGGVRESSGRVPQVESGESGEMGANQAGNERSAPQASGQDGTPEPAQVGGESAAPAEEKPRPEKGTGSLKGLPREEQIRGAAKIIADTVNDKIRRNNRGGAVDPNKMFKPEDLMQSAVRIVDVTESKDANKLRGILHNGNKGSIRAFEAIAGVKLPGAQGARFAAIDRFCGVTPEERKRREDEAKARAEQRETEERNKALIAQGERIAKSTRYNYNGRVRTLADIAREQLEKGWTVDRRKRGATMQTVLVSPDGDSFVPMPGKTYEYLADLEAKVKAERVEESDNFDDIDAEAVRQELAQGGIENGQVVNTGAAERDPFIETVSKDAEQEASNAEKPMRDRILDAIETDARDGLVKIVPDGRYGDGAHVVYYAPGSNAEVERAVAGIRKAFPDKDVLSDGVQIIVAPKRKRNAAAQTAPSPAGETPAPRQEAQPPQPAPAPAPQQAQWQGGGRNPAWTDEQRNRLVADIHTAYREALRSGTGEKPIKSINDLRRRAGKFGMAADKRGADDAELQELLELALVRTAREALESGSWGNNPKSQYAAMLKLYGMQMTVGRRDTQREKLQQFSTPIPMSFLADWWAYNDRAGEVKSVLEPTAGNGMLLVNIPARLVRANEISERRLANLRAQGFPVVTQQDARDAFDGGPYDAVVANPPFGKSDREMVRDGRNIAGLDRQMTVNMLDAMADDGRAAIIIGGEMDYHPNGAVKSNAGFWSWLYDHYNVKGVIEMAGDLYAGQGTKYSTLMILIDGRRSEEERARSQVHPPVKEKAVGKVDNFNDLYQTVSRLLNTEGKTDGYEEILQSPRVPDGAVAGNASGRADGGGRAGEHRPGAGKHQGGVAGAQGAVLGPRAGSELSPGRPGDSSVVDADHRTGADGGGLGAVGGRDGNVDDGLAPDGRAGELRDGPGGRGEGGLPQTGGRSRGGPGGNRGPGGRGGTGGSSVDDHRPDDGGVSVGERKPPSRPQARRTLESENIPYRQHSSARSLESVAPAHMAEAMDKTLAAIEKETGTSVDEAVRGALEYESDEELHNALAAEQVDSVGMAIHQLRQGQSLIIGDQTGVGKGRQMAALVRYAVKSGHKPVFFTKDSKLFTDLYRDMVDTGSGDLRPLIINSDGVMTDQDGNIVYRCPKSKMAAILASGAIPDGYDYAVVTYSQFSNEKLSKARMDFMRAVAENNYLLLDESHQAAGDSARGKFLREIVGKARGVVFASATSTKRPDTMPLYSIKSAIGRVKLEGGKEVADLVEAGGAPLMEILSRAITDSGQMVRRERDMTGVESTWETEEDPAKTKEARRLYDETLSLFNEICDFQSTFVQTTLDDKSNDIAQTGATAGQDKRRKNVGVDNIPLFSKTHVYIRQLLLALKSQSIVERVDQEIKDGRHPVIALESTMEAALAGIPTDTPMENDTMALSLWRALEGTLQYTVTKDGKKDVRVLDPAELGTQGERAYYRLREKIMHNARLTYISPIDAIVRGLEAKGYKVGEISGRSLYVDRDEQGRSVVRRRGKVNQNDLMRRFNDGRLDVLILSKSGSTGISLHASGRFKDQRQRSMIIAQSMLDISEYQQMLGRIDRTGQVHRGRYINLSMPIAAEQRQNMMLRKKLKMMNAATTTSQERSSDNIEVEDLINKYGARVMIELLAENPDLYARLRDPLKIEAATEDEFAEKMAKKATQATEEAAQKILGRVAWLPTQEQDEFYDEVVARFRRLVEYLDEIGDNDLHIRALPLDARPVRSSVFIPGSNSRSGNVLEQDAVIEEIDAKNLVKPMTLAEIQVAVKDMAKGAASSGAMLSDLADASLKDQRAAEEKCNADAMVAIAEARERAAKIADREKREEAMGAVEARQQAAVRRHNGKVDALDRLEHDVDSVSRYFTGGKVYRIPSADAIFNGEVDLKKVQEGATTYGVFLGFRSGKKVSRNGVTLVFAPLDGNRRFEVPLAKRELLEDIAGRSRYVSFDLSEWDSRRTSGGREKRVVLTGNVLLALSGIIDPATGHPKGKVISFTDSQGNVRDGVLMPKNFDLRNVTPNASIPILKAEKQLTKTDTTVVSVDGKVRISSSTRPSYMGGGKYYMLEIPASRKESGKFETPEMVAMTEYRRGFFSYRGRKQANIPGENLHRVLQLLSDAGVTVNNPDAKISWTPAEGAESAPETQEESGGGFMAQLPGVFTGSAADYDKPSLHYVGTGEGSRVYGWGLYASNVRGVAEKYANNEAVGPFAYARNILAQFSGDRDKALEWIEKGLDAGDFAAEKDIRRAADIIRDGERIPDNLGYLYEQTFFTNRATPEETERHLLKWYDTVTDEQFRWVAAQLRKERDAGAVKDFLDEWELDDEALDDDFFLVDVMEEHTGKGLYKVLEDMLGSPKAASEFLSRAGIDGIKYPVDSFGGKTLKDGDKAGWNYVSFRDDNITMDHKWQDGQMVFQLPEPSEETRKRFLQNQETATWNLSAEPSAVARIPARRLEELQPVCEGTNQGLVRNCIRRLFRKWNADPSGIVNENTGERVVFNPKDAGKMMMQSGVDMRRFAPHMRGLFERSVLAWTEPPGDGGGHAEHPDATEYRQYLAKFDGFTDSSHNIEGPAFVRFTVRVHKGGRHGVHAATVTDIAVLQNKEAAPTVRANKLRGSGRNTDTISSGPAEKLGARDRAFVDPKLRLFLADVKQEDLPTSSIMFQLADSTRRDWSDAKIPELRRELRARGLSANGSPARMRQRLADYEKDVGDYARMLAEQREKIGRLEAMQDRISRERGIPALSMAFGDPKRFGEEYARLASELNSALPNGMDRLVKKWGGGIERDAMRRMGEEADDGMRFQLADADEARRLESGETYHKRTGRHLYKLMRVVDGHLEYPMSGTGVEVPVGKWLVAEDKSRVNPRTGKRETPLRFGSKDIGRDGRPKSNFNTVAPFPGFHMGSLPYMAHIGLGGTPAQKHFQNADYVWVEVDVPMERTDEYARRIGRNNPDGIMRGVIPDGGMYWRKTNPNMKGKWGVAGQMKIVRVLSDDEVDAILDRELPERVRMGRQGGGRFNAETMQFEGQDLANWNLEEEERQFGGASGGASFMAQLPGRPGEIQARMPETVKDERRQRRQASLDLSMEYLPGVSRKRLEKIAEARRALIDETGRLRGTAEDFAKAFDEVARELGMHEGAIKEEQKQLLRIVGAASWGDLKKDADKAERALEGVIARRSIRLYKRGIEDIAARKAGETNGSGVRTGALFNVQAGLAAMKEVVTEEERQRAIDKAEDALLKAMEVVETGTAPTDGHELTDAEMDKAINEWEQAAADLLVAKVRGVAALHPGKGGNLLEDMGAWRDAHNAIEDLAALDKRSFFKEIRERIERAKADRDRLIREITGGHRVPTRAEQETLRAGQGIRKRAVEAWRGLLAMHMSGGREFGEFITNAKDSGFKEGFASHLLHDGLAAAESEERRMDKADGERGLELLKRHFGVSASARFDPLMDLSEFCAPLYQEDAGGRVRNVKVVHEQGWKDNRRVVAATQDLGECKMTLGQLMSYYLYGLQAEAAAQQDFTDTPQFKKGADTSLMESLCDAGFSAETMRQIREVLAEKGLDRLAIAISRDMSSKVPALNGFMRKFFHSSLKEVDFYAPIRRVHFGLDENAEARNGIGGFMGLARSFLKERVSNRRDFQPLNLVDSWINHNKQVNHLLAYADWVGHIGRVFRDQRTQNALSWTLGETGRNAVNTWLDNQANGGRPIALKSSRLTKAWDVLSRNFAGAVTTNPRVALKQLTSPTMALSMLPPEASTRQWLADMFEILASPSKRREFLDMLNSESAIWQTRGSTANDALSMVRNYRKGSKASLRMMRFNRWLGGMTRAGDKTGALMGCYGVYRAYERKFLKEGMDPAAAKKAALERFEDAVNSGQQSALTEYMSYAQTHGRGLRFLYMFKSAQAAMTRNFFLHADSWAKGRGSRKQHIRGLLGILASAFLFREMARAMNPLLTLMGLGGGGGDDDDKEKKKDEALWQVSKDLILSVADSSTSGIMLFGDMINHLCDYALSQVGHSALGLEKAPRKEHIATALFPSFKTFDDLEDAIGKATRGDWESAFRYAARAVGSATGAAGLLNAMDIGEGVVDAFTADDLTPAQRVGRALSFSRSSMGAPQAKKPKPPKTPQQQRREDFESNFTTFDGRPLGPVTSSWD